MITITSLIDYLIYILGYHKHIKDNEKTTETAIGPPSNFCD
jgi:hypothetical protein